MRGPLVWRERSSFSSFVLAISMAAPTVRGSDPVAEKELAAGRDPSFDSVGSHYPAMKKPREVIGVKEHRDEFIVMPDARLNFTPSRVDHWRGHISGEVGARLFPVGAAPTRGSAKAAAGPSRGSDCSDGYMPIVIADFEPAGGIRNAAEIRADRRGVVRGDEPGRAAVGLRAAEGLQSGRPRREAQARLAYVDYGVRQERKVRKVADWKLKLAPGAEQTVYGKLPFLDGHEKARESSAAEFEQRLAEAAAFWETASQPGHADHVPEQRVNDAYRAWLAYTFLNVDKVGDRYEPHDGSGFYESIFGIMAAKYCNALGLTGHPDEARTYLDSLAYAHLAGRLLLRQLRVRRHRHPAVGDGSTLPTHRRRSLAPQGGPEHDPDVRLDHQETGKEARPSKRRTLPWYGLIVAGGGRQSRNRLQLRHRHQAFARAWRRRSGRCGRRG